MSLKRARAAQRLPFQKISSRKRQVLPSAFRAWLVPEISSLQPRCSARAALATIDLQLRVQPCRRSSTLPVLRTAWPHVRAGRNAEKQWWVLRALTPLWRQHPIARHAGQVSMRSMHRSMGGHTCGSRQARARGVGTKENAGFQATSAKQNVLQRPPLHTHVRNRQMHTRWRKR